MTVDQLGAGRASEHTQVDAASGAEEAACCDRKGVTALGSMLWHRRVSGTRVVARGAQQSVAGIAFRGYGSSCDGYPHHYITAAAALGASRQDVDVFLERLIKCWHDLRRKRGTYKAGSVDAGAPEDAVA